MKTILEYSFVISAFVGLMCWKEMYFRPIRVLAIYWTVYVAVDLNLERLDTSDGKLIRFAYCLLYPIGLAIYVYIFNEKQSVKNYNYWIQWILVSLVFVISIYYILYSLDEETAANDVFLVQGVCTLYVVLNYFRNILFSNDIIRLSSAPLFWIATGILFYTVGNAIASGFYHQIYAYSKEMAIALYKLNYILNVVMSVMFAIAFIISTKKISINFDGY